MKSSLYDMRIGFIEKCFEVFAYRTWELVGKYKIKILDIIFFIKH